MKPRIPRLSVRALILQEDRLLLVNAWPTAVSDLWCAPGGGVHAGQSLPDNLVREVHEETGLTIVVGDPALVNEFHDPATAFIRSMSISTPGWWRVTLPRPGPIPRAW
jgi:8-oxo-dGTP diphosphatase